MKNKPKSPSATPGVQPGLSPSGGSARAGPLHPRYMLHVVLQVVDTPENQIAMKAVYDAIKMMPIPYCNRAILKCEQIEIAMAEQPMPNEKAET